MSKKLILSKKTYDFVNTEGERIQGLKLAYLNESPSKRENEEGFTPMILNISNKELLKSLEEIPGIYEMDFDQVTGKNNKPELLLSEIKFLAPAEITLLF